MRYKILGASTTNGLEQEVNEAIAQGWVPLGGVAIAMSPDSLDILESGSSKYDVVGESYLFCQAMTKVESDRE